MRVISGSARGRQLATFAGREIRPTPDRVREALFSMLYSRYGALAECKVLDLYAGSGALGIEALSRGALHAWFVDSSRQALRMIGTNLERCRLAPRATIVPHDIWQALPNMAEAGPFAVIFADPPYGCDHGPRLLEEMDRLGLLAPRGLLFLETAASDQIPDRSGTLHLLDQRRYGSTLIHIFHVRSEDPA
jgi:16S rRNA (guanine(966)-N(2))-methyltransferase RsmD